MPDNPHDTPHVVVGPLLRYVDDTCATVWVETNRACEVDVLGRRSATWSVHGHHYALVVLNGLEPATETAYTVLLDGAQAWPEPGSTYPPSIIRTLGEGTRVRLAFGSCRRAAPFDRKSLRTVGADALVALAQRMMGGDREQWPDTLFLAGDQVYADDPSPALRTRLSRLSALGRRDDEDAYAASGDDVRREIVDFEEYTWLYQESWRTPDVRWLLSTVPTCMILDDHDLRDDWNSSWAWRQETTRKPWWRYRVQGAFSSYWVYQHLGNLSPDQLERNDVYRQVREAPDDASRERLLADFAWQADREPHTVRWSFHRDFGRTRLVVVDSRCARRLDLGNRRMVNEVEWSWVREAAGADVDHLLIGTSLPFLLVHGVHHLEGWDEAVVQGVWGHWGARFGEWARRKVDLEHWSAFRRSFTDMVTLVQDVSHADGAPASVLWLSGDVHCSYLARAQVEGVDPARTAVHQLTMSPFRNPLEPWVRLANRWLDRPRMASFFRLLARRAGVVDAPISWDVEQGPWFENGLMTVAIDGRRAGVEVEHARVVGSTQVLERTLTATLTST